MRDIELTLAPGVEISPIEDIPISVREKIDAGADSYIVTRRQSRLTSSVVDREVAALLRLFNSPTSVADGILAFALVKGADARSIADEIYPVISRFMHDGILIQHPTQADPALHSTLTVGSLIEGFQIRRAVQVLDDSEVFLAKSADGAYAAVKHFRGPYPLALRALQHETEMMQRAPRELVPAIISTQASSECVALLIDWVFGRDAAKTAARIRRTGTQKDLLSLCIDIVEAFAGLHASGLLHGDIHPRNVIVAPNGGVRIIDFGHAQDVSIPGSKVPRGGVAFYLDPEYARASLLHKNVPLTSASEQYSVAALLYELWTGVYYVDWRLERKEMLRQIATEEPAGFEARGIEPWPELEQTLGRALSKTADSRFESMTAFAEALYALRPGADTRDKAGHRPESPLGLLARDLAESLMDRYDIGGKGWREVAATAPVASVNYGAAGIAYAMLRISQRRSDGVLLATADAWMQRAYELSTDARAFYSSELSINPATVGEVSLFHSASGLHCVRALVSTAQGDHDSARKAIDSFVALSTYPTEQVDLTLGKASLLVGLSEIIDTLPGTASARAIVVSRGNEISTEILALLTSESVETSSVIRSLGIAHGSGGLLYALLRWAHATKTVPGPIVSERLFELASMAEPDGSGKRWPVGNLSGAGNTFMDGWCNGTAGHAMLFALAYDTLGHETFAELAEQAAESAWATELDGGSLCCGLAGIGYSCLTVYRLSGSALWLERARRLADRATLDRSRWFFRDSLYKGAVGVALLAESIECPDILGMPLFEPIR